MNTTGRSSKTAFFGDSVGWQVFVLDLSGDPLKVTKTIPTELGPYPVDRVNDSTLFAITRGALSVTWIDLQSLETLGNIPLPHKPRSATGNGRGLALISGADQPQTSVVDLTARRVRLTVGNETSDRVADFGGSLASGHEAWLPDLADGTQRFFVLDRIRRTVAVYRYPDGMRLWSVNTPTAVHHVLQDKSDGSRWYAICEGSARSLVAPSVIALRETQANTFAVEALAPLPVAPADLPKSGAHHIDQNPTDGTLYVGSNEGYVYVLDGTSLAELARIPTGAGCGHTRFTTFDGRSYAVTTNHLAKHISIIDTDTLQNIADVPVTNAIPTTTDDKTQGHTSRIYPDTPHLYYMMASMDATLCEVDLRTLAVSRRLTIPQGPGTVGPFPLQGIFL